MKKLKRKWLSKLVLASVMAGALSFNGIACADSIDMTGNYFGDDGTFTITKAINDEYKGFNGWNFVYKYDKATQNVLGANIVVETLDEYKESTSGGGFGFGGLGGGSSWQGGTNINANLCINASDLEGLSDAEYEAVLKKLAAKVTNNMEANRSRLYLTIQIINPDGTFTEKYKVVTQDPNNFYDTEPFVGQLGDCTDANINTVLDGNNKYFKEQNSASNSMFLGSGTFNVTPDFSKKSDDGVYKAIYNSGKYMAIDTESWGEGRWENASGTNTSMSGTLNVVADASADDKSKVYGIYQDTGSYMEVAPKNLNLTVKGNDATGIYAGNDSGIESKILLGQNANITVEGIEKATAIEAGANGVLAFRGSGSTVTATSNKGYALYAHDGGVIKGEGWVLFGTRQQAAPNFNLTAGENGIAAYAEKGGKIDISLSGLSGGLATDDDPNSNIKATWSTTVNKTLGSMEGNVDLSILNSNRSYSKPVVITGDFDGNSLSVGSYVEWNGSSNLDELNNITMANYAAWDLTEAGIVPNLSRLDSSASKTQRSYVFMGSNDLNIDTYTGNTTFAYAHDSEDPTIISGGNITIQSAEPTLLISTGLGDFDDNPDEHGSGGNTVTKEVPTTITLATSSDGIDLEDEEQVGAVLSNLASKLFYLGYVDGERNLEGTVEIAEGLTTGKLMSKVVSNTFADIVFDEKTGQASRDEHFYTPRSKKITGNINVDGKDGYYGDVAVDVNGDNTHIKYDFVEDTSIRYNTATENLSGSKTYNIAAIGNYGVRPETTYAVNMEQVSSYPTGGPNITIDMHGNDLEIYSISSTSKSTAGYPMWTTTGIWACREGSIVIDNPGKIYIDVDANYYYGSAIRASTNSIKGDTEEGAHVIINNDNNPENAVVLRGGIPTPGFELNYRAITVSSSKENSVEISGLVDVESQYACSVFARTGYITIGGGKIYSEAYDAVWTSAGGQVDLNIVKDSEGNITAGNNDLVIIGGVATATPYYGSGGIINTAFATENSSMTGAVYGLGENNVWLQNGATWNQQAMQGHSWSGGTISIGERESEVDNLYGGDSIENAGIINVFNQTKGTTLNNMSGYVNINMFGGADVAIDNYDGNITAFYKHNQINDPTEIYGGNITIGKATEGSTITLVTNSAAIDMNDADEVNGVLNALAEKLFYTGYADVVGEDGVVVEGERNLDGYVKIAEGLTTAAVTKYVGDVEFDKENGQGGLLEGSLNPEITKPATPVVKEKFESALGAGEHNFTADKNSFNNAFETKEDVYYGEAVDTTISAAGDSVLTKVEVGNKELNIGNVSADNHAFGIVASGSGEVVMNNVGELNINAQATGEGKNAAALYAQDGGKVEINVAKDGIVNLVADGVGSDSSVVNAQGGAQITVNGMVNIDVEGKNVKNAVNANAATVNIGGGAIVVGEGKVAIKVEGVAEQQGVININTDENGKGKGNEVRIKGDVSTKKETTTFRLARMTGDQHAMANITLGTKESKWEGNYLGDANSVLNLTAEAGSEWIGNVKEDGKANVVLAGGNWTGQHLGAELNLSIKEGSVWTNTNEEAATVINSFAGAKGNESVGYVVMSNKDLNITEYGGSAIFAYNHDVKETVEGEETVKEITVKGGNLNITSAAENSKVVLSTDQKGINIDDDVEVRGVLEDLAEKLTYAGAPLDENNLLGYVQISEGLTNGSIAMKAGQIDFDNEGKGFFKENNAIWETVEDLRYTETDAMSSVKSAMMSNAMMWRSESNDLLKRMGDLRTAEGEHGIWAKYYGGKYEMDAQNTNFKTSYNAYQVGYDKKVENGWTLGAAMSYSNGDSNYGGTAGYGHGDTSVMSLGLYGTWNHDDGRYVDLILKRSKLDNEFENKTFSGFDLEGDYETWGTSFSAEFGKRINMKNGVYVDPSVEFTYGSVQDASYSVDASGMYDAKFLVNQEEFESLVGRVGLRVGKQTERSNIYAKLGLAHEFCGEYDTYYKEAGSSKAAHTSVDLSDTWYEMQLGGNLKLNDNSLLYATFERSFGGDVEQKWRIDAGLRWSF